VDRRLRDRLPTLTWNPLRDEGAAFQLVFVTIGAFGLIALGSWISTWVGLGVVAALLAVGCALVWRWRRRRLSTTQPTQRLLLVGEPSAELIAALRTRAEVSVVDVEATVEEALQTFAADEIVALDPATVAVLRARFVVPVRAVSAEDYLPETASR
jgi:hypothetical protein